MKKVNKLSRNLAIASLLAPVGVNALGIGEIELHSALNQNFSAEIPLIASPSENTKNIRIKLASPAAFERAGVERSYLLSTLKFRPELNADGTMSVKVLSSDAIREPFLNFVIEVQWAEGRMLKEYTVLLDPPSMIAQPVVTAQTAPNPQPNQTLTATQPAAVTDSATEEGQLYGGQIPVEEKVVDLPVATSIPVAKNTETVVTSKRPVSTSNNKDSVIVPKGAVLWDIANQMREQVGVSQEQMLVALFRANPDAFYNNNINALKAGAELKFPGPDLLDEINERESVQTIKQQNQSWNQTLMANADRDKTTANVSQKGQLKLTATEGDVADAKDQALLERLQSLLAQIDLMTEENAGLKNQVAELEARVQELTRQATDVNVDQAQVDETPVQVAQTDVDSDASMTQPDVDDTIAQVDDVSTAEGDTVVDTDTAQSVDQVITDQPAEITTPAETATVVKPVIKRPVQPVQTTAQPESSFLSDIMESPWAIGSVLGALMLGLVGWLMNKRRKQALQNVVQEEIDLNESDSELADDQHINDEDDAVVAEAGDLNQAPKQDSELGDSVFFSEYRPTEMQMDGSAMEVDHNDLDPLSEADVYVAYGRYQQAEDLILQALADHPERDEYKLKLLEIYHAKDDNAGFAAYVTQLKEEGKTTSSDFWTRAQDIGAGFAPDNLFGEVSSSDETSAVDDFTSELFGVDSQNESLELTDDLSAVLSDDKPADTRDLGANMEDVQSIDLSDAGETVEQLETAFALDDLDSEEMQISLGEDDSFDAKLSGVDQDLDIKEADEQQNDNLLSLDMTSDETEEMSSELSSEISIDFDVAHIESLETSSDVDNTNSLDQSEGFAFDSEIETSSWDLDMEALGDVETAVTEVSLDSSGASQEESVAEIEAEAHDASETVEQMELTSSDIETSESLGIVSSDDAVSDPVEVDQDLTETNITNEGVIELELDKLEAESISEDFQLVTEDASTEAASVEGNNEDQLSYDVSTESTMFHFDDISSELVESAQISEMLDEVSHRNTEFAEESVISELFDPASVIQESELFESELSELDEVADKLDLAKVYIDMEDGESARGILNEVIESGNDDQKEVAKSLVQALEKSA
ncbi:MAG TPA: hypothetical protein ENJ32_09530 [Crenotrichaceae bacterium]|nr:hypothetical protein [Crenotrichaceae bacterium]